MNYIWLQIARSKTIKVKLFAGENENFEPVEIMNNVADFVLEMCCFSMSTSQDQTLLFASLEFFELVSTY